MSQLSISDIVDVTVSLDTTSSSSANFNIPLIIATHQAFTARYAIYTSASSMLEDGFTSTSPAYQMALLIFEGSQAPKEVIVGRRVLGDIVISVDDVEEGDDYYFTMQIGNTTTSVSYTAVADSSGETTAVSILTALAEAYAALDGVGTYTIDSDASTLTIDSPNTTDIFNITAISDNMSLTFEAGAENMTNAYTNITTALSTSFFFVLADSHDADEVLEIFAQVESDDHFYVTSTSDENCGDSTSTSDIMYTLSDKSYQKGLVMYHEDADTDYPEAALIGAWAATNPGTTTLHGKTLTGISTSDVDATFRSAVQAKYGCTYPDSPADGFFLDGYVPDGNFADTIRFALWVKARIGEAVFNLIKNKSDAGSKVPYNSTGFAMVESAIEEPLNIADNRGCLTADDDGDMWVITIPDKDDQSTTNIDARLLDDVTVTMIYSGAIHRVNIAVTISA